MADSHREDARPAFQFYPKDWLSDTELGMCSLSAKGLWIDLLCLMWNAPIRGVLMYSPDGICHSKLDGKRLAKTLRCHEDEVAAGMKELLENGVASLDEHGFFYSRRMRRGGKLAEIRSEAGKKGAEKRWNTEEKMANEGFAMAKSMANDGPSSASASSSASSSASASSDPSPKKEDQIPPVGGGGCPLELLPDMARAYPEIRRLIVEANRHAKLPGLGTRKELDDRKVLQKLVATDGHSELQVVKTLMWVLTEEERSPDGFCWRDQFQSVSGLRVAKDGLTKFAKMLRSFTRSGMTNGQTHLVNPNHAIDASNLPDYRLHRYPIDERARELARLYPDDKWRVQAYKDADFEKAYEGIGYPDGWTPPPRRPE